MKDKVTIKAELTSFARFGFLSLGLTALGVWCVMQPSAGLRIAGVIGILLFGAFDAFYVYFLAARRTLLELDDEGFAVGKDRVAWTEVADIWTQNDGGRAQNMVFVKLREPRQLSATLSPWKRRLLGLEDRLYDELTVNVTLAKESSLEIAALMWEKWQERIGKAQ